MLLSDTLRWMQDELQKRFADQSSREAYAILLSLERFETMSQIIIGLDHIRLDDHEIALLKNWLKRRLDGEPLAYIRGYEYHYGRKFQVDKNVLIPRPETELITQRCLQIHGGSTTSNLKCLDIGTGSGILSVSLKLDLADSVWTATDISHECLKIAKKNSQLLNADVKFIQSYCARGLKGSFDIIVSNPPYIPFGDPLVQREVEEYEPHLALYAEENGLSLIYEILDSMIELLSHNGVGLMEIGHNQKDEVETKLSKFDNIKTFWIYDFANIPRILEIKKNAIL